jgi:hypothetical protein
MPRGDLPQNRKGGNHDASEHKTQEDVFHALSIRSRTFLIGNHCLLDLTNFRASPGPLTPSTR